MLICCLPQVSFPLYASLSTRSTAPAPPGDTPNSWGAHTQEIIAEASRAKRSERKRLVGPKSPVNASPPGLLVSATLDEFIYFV